MTQIRDVWNAMKVVMNVKGQDLIMYALNACRLS
jgi:hypothetical protein